MNLVSSNAYYVPRMNGFLDFKGFGLRNKAWILMSKKEQDK